MPLEIVSTRDGFAHLRAEWDLLTNEPLRSFAWHYAWWESYQTTHELRIYVYRESGKLLGIAPFFVDRWLGQKRLRFLGSGNVCTDYAQIITADNLRKQIAGDIIEDLQATKSVAMVELEGIGNSDSDQIFCSDLKDVSYWRYDRQLEPTWIIELPATWKMFKERSSSSLRRKIKKAETRLDSGEVVVRSTSIDLDFDIAFEKLIELHQERFVSKGEPGVFSDQRFRSFLGKATRTLVEQQAAEILLGYRDDEAFVAHLYLNGTRGPQLYQSGVRTSAMKLEPGHLMFTYAVRKAIENGHAIFDFLRGSEAYKPFWGAVPQPLTLARCVSSNLIPTSINRSYQFLRHLKHLFRPKNPATH